MSRHPLYNDSGLQKNNKSHVLYALASKQQELTQLREDYEQKVLKIAADMEALKRTMCLFDGDCDKIDKKIKNTVKNKPKRQYRGGLFKTGELKPMILKIIRTADNSLKSDDIAYEIIDIKKFDLTDEILARVQKSVTHQVRELEKQNLIETDGKEGLNFLWKIRD